VQFAGSEQAGVTVVAATGDKLVNATVTTTPRKKTPIRVCAISKGDSFPQLFQRDVLEIVRKLCMFCFSQINTQKKLWKSFCRLQRRKYDRNRLKKTCDTLQIFEMVRSADKEKREKKKI
jgi:hypothetical protein